MSDETQLLILDAHPLRDGRINRHISYIHSKNKYEIYRLNVNLSDTTDNFKNEITPTKLYQIKFPEYRNSFKRKIDRLVRYVLFATKKDAKNYLHSLGINCKKTTIIHIHDPLLLIGGIRLTRYFETSNIVYDKHENYFQTASLTNFGEYFTKYIETKYAPQTDGIVIVHPSHKKTAEEVLNCSNIVEIPNYPENKVIENTKILDKITSIKSSNKIIITYIGSLYWNFDRDIRTILYTAKNLLPKYSFVQMIIGGATTDAELLHELSVLSNKYPEQFKYVGFITPKEIMEIHQKSHFGFYMIKPDTDAWIASSANKIYEYLACGMIPILRTPQTDYDDFSSCSLIFKRDDSKEFILKEIENLLNDKERIQTLMHASFELGQNYSFEAVANRYIELYDSILK